MRIRELSITDFRAFSGLHTFRFSDRFTVVAGVNGRGKTALLDALALVASRLLPHVSPARSGYRTIVPSELNLNAESAELSVKVNCAGIPLDYRLTYTRESRKIAPTKIPIAVKRAIQQAYGDPSRTDDAAPLVVYYTTDRAGYRLPRKLPSEIPNGQAAAYAGALFNRTVNFRDFMARYRNAIALENGELQSNPNFLGDRVVGSISRAVTDFLGGFSNLRVQEHPLRLLVDKAGAVLDLSQLSDGERAFLAMVCDLGRRLALANPMFQNPLHGAGVVLIDELELHLHPQWQREIVEKLRRTFPNIQFIATTHSPFIIQTLRPDELIVLDDLIVGSYENRGLEEIAAKIMGIRDPEVSPRYFEMLDAAKIYYRALDSRLPVTPKKKAALKRRLKKLARPYADNPAYQALLELERVKAFKE